MRVIIFVINLSLRFISPLERFSEDFQRERTPCTGVIYASPFHSLSIYPLHLSLSYISLPLYISPSTFLSLSILSLPPSLYISFYLSLSLSLILSLFSLSFSLAYIMDVFVLAYSIKLINLQYFWWTLAISKRFLWIFPWILDKVDLKDSLAHIFGRKKYHKIRCSNTVL